MTTYSYTQTAAQLQSNQDKVSATTGDLIDTDNLDANTASLGYSKYTENRFKGNQNFNVIGSTGDPLPDGTPKTYTVGSEIAAGIEVITNDAEQITYTSGVLNSGNNTGILRRRYTKDQSGLITKSTQYGGIKLPDGSQLQALEDDIATNGVRITEDGSDVVIDVDLSVITTGFRFFGMSDEVGIWGNVNDEDSLFEFSGTNGFDLSSNGYQIFKNGMIIQWGQMASTTGGNPVSFPVPFPTSVFVVLPTAGDTGISSAVLSTGSWTTFGFNAFAEAGAVASNYKAIGR